MEKLMSWLEVGPNQEDVALLPSAGFDQSEEEYEAANKDEDQIDQVLANQKPDPVVSKEDVEDMKSRLATFEYLLR